MYKTLHVSHRRGPRLARAWPVAAEHIGRARWMTDTPPGHDRIRHVWPVQHGQDPYVAGLYGCAPYVRVLRYIRASPMCMKDSLDSRRGRPNPTHGPRPCDCRSYSSLCYSRQSQPARPHDSLVAVNAIPTRTHARRHRQPYPPPRALPMCMEYAHPRVSPMCMECPRPEIPPPSADPQTGQAYANCGRACARGPPMSDTNRNPFVSRPRGKSHTQDLHFDVPNSNFEFFCPSPRPPRCLWADLNGPGKPSTRICTEGRPGSICSVSLCMDSNLSGHHLTAHHPEGQKRGQKSRKTKKLKKRKKPEVDT